jgi:glycosyltransferase involved in cell wall biosynthesis
MTVRNNAPTIVASLDSIRPELARGGELVIVDALSNDGTQGILEGIARADPRVTVVEKPGNRGVGRNLAVATSRAPIVITQVDGDNRYAPGALSTVAAYARAHPEVGLVFTVGALDRDPSTTRFFAWRREAFDRAGGYPLQQEREDPPLLLRAFRAGFLVKRFELPMIATDLKTRAVGNAPTVSPWRRSGHTMRAARKFRLMGFRYGEYLRLLWLTRRTALRFGAAVVVGGLAYLEGAVRRDEPAYLERDDPVSARGVPANVTDPVIAERK